MCSVTPSYRARPYVPLQYVDHGRLITACHPFAYLLERPHGVA